MPPNGLSATARSNLVSFQRRSASLDDAGHPTVAASWAELGKAWAAIFYGNGSEQRQAAQESAVQAATFEVLSNPMTRSLSMQDRICFPMSGADPAEWPTWDITAISPIGHNEGVRVTATRAVN